MRKWLSANYINDFIGNLRIYIMLLILENQRRRQDSHVSRSCKTWHDAVSELTTKRQSEHLRTCKQDVNLSLFALLL